MIREGEKEGVIDMAFTQRRRAIGLIDKGPSGSFGKELRLVSEALVCGLSIRKNRKEKVFISGREEKVAGPD